MSRYHLIAGAIALTLLHTTVQAESKLYCTVTGQHYLSSEGKLMQYEGEYFNPPKGDQRSEFILDRDTGRILGIRVHNDMAKQTHVIDRGSTEQSYKAISIFQLNYTVSQYIEVQVYAKEEQKPFILVEGSIYSGYCTIPK